MKNFWNHKKLGEVFTLEYGKPLSANQRKINGKYPVYGANGIKTRTDSYYYDQPSIIVGRKGSAGEINLTGEKFWPLDVTYFTVFDQRKYNRKFLFYLLSQLQLQKLARGVKPGINRNDVYSIEADFPPLPEQQRIVEILDQSFAAIDQAIEYTEKNSANVQDLFTVYLDLLISNSKNNWKETCLEDLYDVRDGTHESPKFLDSGYPFITSKNLKGDVINFDNIKFISKEDYDSFNKRSKVNKGDILFAMIGTIGNPVVVEIEPNFAIKNVALIKVPSSQSNHYLKYYLQSKSVMSRFIDNAKGTTQRFVGLGNVRKTKIILPPLDE